MSNRAMSSNTNSSGYVDIAAPASPGSDASATSSNLLVSDTSRPIIISSSSGAGATFVRIAVPFEPASAWIAAEVVRDEFQRFLAKTQNEDASLNVQQEQAAADEEAATGSPVDAAKAAAAASGPRITLLSKFLGFLAQKLRATDAPLRHELEVLSRAWHQFHADFLGTASDVHGVVNAAIDIDQRPVVLRNFFEAYSVLETAGRLDAAALRTPKLFRLVEQDKAKAFAIFGGQGNNEVYFNELQALYDTYRPLVEELLHKSTVSLQALAGEASLSGFTNFYTHGVDVLSWLQHPETRPPVAYLASVPLSLPLIGLTQLTQYLVSTRSSGLHPGQMRGRLAGGSTGHSQGIISAVVISASESLDSFYANVLKAVGLLFHIGKRGQEAFPTRSIEPALVADAVDGGEGEPTPMLSVTGLTQEALESFLKKTNVHLADEDKVGISLFNSRRNFVVTGPPRSLFGLVCQMRVARAESGQDQSKVAFSKRKQAFNMRFLPVGVPYHSSYLEGATAKVADLDYQGADLWTASELSIAVHNTFDGSDLRTLTTDSIVRSVSDQIFTQPIFWDKATNVQKGVTHIVDFGTGGLSGIGGLTARNLEGRGVRVVVPSGAHASSAELYSLTQVKFEPQWDEAFMPKLVKNAEGKILIDTPYSRLTSRKPLLIAGMTPSTVQPGLLVAAAKAGANAEIAGGGHYSPRSMLSKVQTIQNQIPPGNGLSWNALFINPRHFPWQLSEWCSLRKQGYPLDAWTTAAGIPSTEKSKEIVAQLVDAGIEHMTLKPGSLEGIRQTCAIAAANPDFAFVLNWTGGRAGGHHSYEDVYQPIIQTYSLIRKYPNISLLAGSGLGDSESVWPWMSGEWSSQFGLPPMPFDGALLASRVMVAKEAHTSPAVKQLIVDAPGVDDAQWEGTYEKETGGILTVVSELGEPIHKIATRGVKLWAELDKKLFSLNKDKRMAWVSDVKNAKWIKERLNADFQKPWFPAKLDGTMCDELADMTYEEVTRRLLRLTYVQHQSRFIDGSYVRLLGDWIRRVEERFASIDDSQRQQKSSVLQSYSTLQEQPHAILDSFFAEYPSAKDYWISAEDVGFFIQICQRRGQKPVPFIPALDENLQTWFKKDSLWFAEDLDAVFDQDAQRVCILQGPVAVKYAKKVDEPLAEILGEIDDGIIKRLLNKHYGGDVNNVPSVDYLGKSPKTLDAGLLSRHGIVSSVDQSEGGVVRTFKLGASLPKASEWLEFLAGDKFNWLRALFCSVSVVQGTNFADNPLARIAAPRSGQTVSVTYDGRGEPRAFRIKGAARSYGAHDPNFTVVNVERLPNSARIAVTLCEERLGESVPLELFFDYVPASPKQIHEVMEGRSDRIKQFYWKLWFQEEMPDVAQLASIKEHTGPTKTLEGEAVRRFVESFGQTFQSAEQAPMDIAIVLGWEGIMKALIAATGSADLLRLVHLSNSFKVVDGARPLRVGDAVSSKASVESIKISETGKTVAVKGTIVRDGKALIEVVSAFFFRGRFTDYSTCFETNSEEYAVQIKTQADASVLLAKEWFEWVATNPLEAGTTLEFRIENDVRFKDSKSFSSVTVKGAAYIRDYRDELVKVGNVDYESDAVTYGNAVTAWMQRVSGKASGPIPLENGGYTIAAAPGQKESVFVAPPSNEPYTLASGDSNPIHVSPVFADFAGLPTTICHGMRQSAVVNAVVASVAAEGHRERCLSWEAAFLGMVNPGDVLTISLRHVAMRGGHKIIKAEAKNQNGDKVLEGTATVQQPPTFYCFTGQGSQEPNMGMDLYTSSQHAKALWDEADAHLQKQLGLSILEIVRENPKSKTVYFGGVKGHQIRQRYQEFTYESVDEQGNSVTLPLFPEITPTSQSFTFFHPVSALLRIAKTGCIRSLWQRGEWSCQSQRQCQQCSQQQQVRQGSRRSSPRLRPNR
ncbi:unnamed protein product [Parajaminaea phylloscopi]